MNSHQRKAHKYIWLLLIVIVPLIMILSVKDLDLLSSTSNNASQFEGSKKVSLTSLENDIIKASVYQNNIEVILKVPLKNSSSVVYGLDEKGSKTRLIGQLATVGIYNFNLIDIPRGLMVYDELKQVEITKLLFKWD